MKPVRIADVPDVVAAARRNLREVLPRVRDWAADDDWRTREVAASVLVEASRKDAAAVVANAVRWSGDHDPNVRRAACEGLRGVARSDFTALLPVLEALKEDTALYVRKSVANVMRDASKKFPREVLELAGKWQKSDNPNTAWILKHVLAKPPR